MKNELALRLLAAIMKWDNETATREVASLQVLAGYKYDDYQNFEPGIRFIESLALWLQQFEGVDRSVAYDFIKRRLIYISSNEMRHLVQLAYPDRILPILCDQTAQETGISRYSRKKLLESKEFSTLRRRSLFLGLSDGAHIDDFRRSNPFLSNEQVHVTYEIADKKLESMKGELQKTLRNHQIAAPATFRNVFLIDDFAASGNSALRRIDSGEFKGKLAAFARMIEVSKYQDFFDWEQLRVFVLFYLATAQAIAHLEKTLGEFVCSGQTKWKTCELMQAFVLREEIKVTPSSDSEMVRILDQYYDPSVETPHTGCVKYGYENCALPLVLSHNTPNNSLSILWAESEKQKALFRRITRHKVE